MINPAVKIERLAAVLLAAGASTRFGQPKQLADFAGQPLICTALDAVASICGAGVVVVTGASAADVEAAISAYPVRVAHNADWRQGMSASIATGIAALSTTDFDALLIMLCDQPLVGAKDIAQLAELWQNAPNQPAAARYRDRIGVPAIFPAAYIQQLASLEGDSGARALLNEHADISIIDMPAAAFDIDTPDDLRAQRHLLDRK